MPHASAARLLILCAALAFAAPAARAASYDVGPGQPLAAIGAVPWATLGPGDEVRIHWRAEPYREKWVIARSGTAEAPLVVRGIEGPNGERPVVSGEDATTPDPLDFTGEARGVLKIGTSNVPDETLPEHIVVEGLEVRSGHPDYQFTDDHGVVQDYLTNAAAIFVERARHLVIRDCVITDSANGLFVAAFDGDTRDILIQGNFIHGNGNVGRAFEHNAYTAAIGIVYEYNRFGPPRAGAVGNALKDRSAGLVVRYNWIEGGNRQLDLTEGDDTDAIPAHPSYSRTFVYGNVLIEPDGAGNSQIVHYGGDNGVTSLYRKGVLHFFHNTVVSLRSGNTTLMRLSTDDETADVRDNVLYVAAQGSRLAMLDETGTLLLGHNWLKPGWLESHSGPADVVDAGGNLEEAEPGFADAAAQDYRLLPGAGPIDAGTALHPEALPDHVVVAQYAKHQGGVARSDAGAPDLGAFPAPEPGAGAAALAAALAVAGLACRRGPATAAPVERPRLRRVKLLALDFDGVVSDSAREAFAVARRTYTDLRPASPLRAAAEEPLWRAFLALMPLGNRAEDYAAALAAIEAGVDDEIDDQAAYDAWREAQEPGWLRAFHRHFYEVRAALSEADRDAWLAMLGPYPRLLEILRRRAGSCEYAIASAKDRRSVGILLAHYGVAELFAAELVVDKEAGVTKDAHLLHLARLRGLDPAEITFVDDKVNHLDAVAPLGVRCALAAWGYNGPREHRLARAHGHLLCTLDDVDAQLFGA